MHSLVILFDLSAAFDTVEPTVLIRKLKIYEFDQNSRFVDGVIPHRQEPGGNWEWTILKISGVKIRNTSRQPAIPAPVHNSYGRFGFVEHRRCTQPICRRYTEFPHEKKQKRSSERLQKKSQKLWLATSKPTIWSTMQTRLHCSTTTGGEQMEIAGEDITSVSSEKLLGLYFSSALSSRLEGSYWENSSQTEPETWYPEKAQGQNTTSKALNHSRGHIHLSCKIWYRNVLKTKTTFRPYSIHI